MMSAKLDTLGLPKKYVFWSKGYDVIICLWRPNKILSCDSNYIVDVVMWPKFGHSNIPIREFIIKLKVRKFWGLIFTFVEVKPPILNRVKKDNVCAFTESKS